MLSPNTTPEEKKELIRLSLLQLLGLFPIAGSILKDVLFEYRNNVKQERLNHFISLLEDAFIIHGINVEKLKTEEVLDLLEQLINKVVQARSINKRTAFKSILINGIVYPEKITDCEVFSELLHELKEVQLKILAEHKNYLSDGQPLLLKLQSLNKNYRNNTPGQTYLYTEVEAQINRESLKKNIDEVKDLIEEYKQKCNASLFNIDNEQYQYFLRDLTSKGLLIDQGIGTYDPTPLKYMGITDFGLRFLDFILSE
jgi:hypothetical protein